MQNQKFDWTEIKKTYDNGLIKDHLDCKQYISKFFVPLTNGTHAQIENNEITIIQKETMNEVYLGRFPIDIKKWYKSETIPKKLICDITKPMIGDDYVNIANKQLFKYETKYDSFEKERKDAVDIMLSYVKDVWANGNEEVFAYLLKWFANVAQGKKNTICPFLKGDQGIGKTTFVEFLVDFAFGKSVCCKGKSDHLKGQHNLQLLGKIFVYFEELQIFSDKEWYAIDSELKDMITSNYASYTDKYEKRFEAENLNNYIIITNKTSLRGIDGRRYFVLDLNPCRMNDFEFYKNLKDKCFNVKVGEAFFAYLMEIDTKDFNPFKYPETKNKMDLIVDLLTPVENFLKNVFVLKNKPITKIQPKVLWDQFRDYDNKCGMKLGSFCGHMRELGLEYKIYTGVNKYNVTLEELQVIAKRKKWIHELDNDANQIVEEEQEEQDETLKPQPVTFRAEDVKILLEEQYDIIKKLQLELLKYQLGNNVKKVEPEDETDEKPKKKPKVKPTIDDLYFKTAAKPVETRLVEIDNLESFSKSIFDLQ